MGRPPKSAEGNVIVRAISFTPELWARLLERIPKGKRSDFIQAAVREKLDREGRG